MSGLEPRVHGSEVRFLGRHFPMAQEVDWCGGVAPRGSLGSWIGQREVYHRHPIATGASMDPTGLWSPGGPAEPAHLELREPTWPRQEMWAVLRRGRDQGQVALCVRLRPFSERDRAELGRYRPWPWPWPGKHLRCPGEMCAVRLAPTDSLPHDSGDSVLPVLHATLPHFIPGV